MGQIISFKIVSNDAPNEDGRWVFINPPIEYNGVTWNDQMSAVEQFVAPNHHVVQFNGGIGEKNITIMSEVRG